MPVEGITNAEMVAKLRTACENAGSIRAWARANGVSAGTVHDILTGRNDMSEMIGNKLGLMRKTVWVPSPFKSAPVVPRMVSG